MATNPMPRPIPLSKEFTVNTNPGLDVRPAAMIVRTLLPVRSAVVAQAHEECADGKSVLGLCSLLATCGTKIKFSATGADAARALYGVQRLFDSQFRSPRIRDAQPWAGVVEEAYRPFSPDDLPVQANLQFAGGEQD